ncbi:glycosyltransferase family 4 protein [Thermodesulfovibrionales bacterium]|nr:glycosyltransferase family 4 protein [Thermodesulfovibrionales bacterium]
MNVSYKSQIKRNLVDNGNENFKEIKQKRNQSTRILVFSELYYPEETGTGYFMTKIAEGLSADFSVMAICAQPTYSMRGTRAPAKEIHNGVSIQRYFSTTFNKDILILRLLNILSTCFSSFFVALRSIRSSDLILVVTSPPLLPFVIWIASKFKGAKFILRIDDVYPDMLNVAGMLKTNSLIYRIFTKLNLRLYREAEHLIVLGRDMRSLVLKKLENQRQDRIHIIPNWGEIDRISPCSRGNNPLLKELQIEDKFVVQYAGNMGYPHDIESLVKAAKILSKHSEIHFLFIGSGVKRKWLENQIRICNLNNITLLNPRHRSDQNNFLNASDVIISALVKGMLGISVPSRMYNIMAAGKPIIALGDENSELALIIREKKIGWIVPPGNADVFVNAVLEAKNNSEQLITMGKRARLLVEKEYSKEHVVELYKNLFNKIQTE